MRTNARCAPAYPAQSNFSGVQHSLTGLLSRGQHGWDVLLDAAAFAPTNRLDLSVVQPDFVTLSFYKMFGFPTGIGALIVRRAMFEKLCRPWFAGGTITLASVQGEGWHGLAPGAAGYEDRTVGLPWGTPGITFGIEHVGGSIEWTRFTPASRRSLATFFEQMALTSHSNSALPRVRPETMDRRGATIAFYLLDPDGKVFDVYRIESLAGDELISVRTGCFCNPGDGRLHARITREEMESCFAKDHSVPVTLEDCQEIIEDATGKVPNTIRVSLGIASTFADVDRFLKFAGEFRDRTADFDIAVLVELPACSASTLAR